jgi:Arc/MetJ-type ribon-helix-helix transcriptional regulator
VTSQIAIRLDGTELAALDTDVAQGRAASRSDAVRRAIAYLRRAQRYRDEEVRLVAIVRKGALVYPELDEMLSQDYPSID